MPVNEKEITLSLWDTAGQEDYDHVRVLSYSNVNVFLICFSVVNPASFENVSAKWIKDVKTSSPDAQIIIVGTKTDMRNDEETIANLAKRNQKPITSAQVHMDFHHPFSLVYHGL